MLNLFGDVVIDTAKSKLGKLGGPSGPSNSLGGVMKKQLILFVVLAMICAFTTVTVHEAHADWRKTIKEKYDSYKRNKQLKKDQNTIGGTGRKETEAEKHSQSSGSQAPKQDNTKATGHTYRTVQIGPWNTYKSGEIHNHLTITNFHFDDGWKYYNREWDRLTFYKNGSKWTLEVSLISKAP